MKTVTMVNPVTGEVCEFPEVRTRFNTDFDKLSQCTSLAEFEKTRTQQQFKDECDINEIVRRFGLTGKLPDNVRMPEYVDYEGVFDFQTAMNTMMDAEREFMKLPASVRRRFDNDPQQLLEFVGNGQNQAEAEALGLLRAKAPPPPPAPPAPAPEPAKPA